MNKFEQDVYNRYIEKIAAAPGQFAGDLVHWGLDAVGNGIMGSIGGGIVGSMAGSIAQPISGALARAQRSPWEKIVAKMEDGLNYIAPSIWDRGNPTVLQEMGKGARTGGLTGALAGFGLGALSTPGSAQSQKVYQEVYPKIFS